MRFVAFLTLLLATIQISPAQSPQARQGGALNACQLVPNADVERVTGQKSFVEPTLSGGGSRCTYDNAQLYIFAGKDAEQQWEATMKAFGEEKAPRTPIAGLGERAYGLFPQPRNKYQDAGAFVVAKQGNYVVAMGVSVPNGKDAHSVQPQAIELAKVVLAKLK